MSKVTYISHDGTTRVVSVNPGQSVMEGAIRNGVPGIDADCGGACACATCHVYVAEEWLAKIAPADETEAGMLEFVEHLRSNSRLSCQIKIDPALDGLTVEIPESQ